MELPTSKIVQRDHLETIPHFNDKHVWSASYKVLLCEAFILLSHVQDLIAYAESGPEGISNRKIHQQLHFLLEYFQTAILGK